MKRTTVVYQLRSKAVTSPAAAMPKKRKRVCTSSSSSDSSDTSDSEEEEEEEEQQEEKEKEKAKPHLLRPQGVPLQQVRESNAYRKFKFLFRSLNEKKDEDEDEDEDQDEDQDDDEEDEEEGEEEDEDEEEEGEGEEEEDEEEEEEESEEYDPDDDSNPPTSEDPVSESSVSRDLVDDMDQEKVDEEGEGEVEEAEEGVEEEEEEIYHGKIPPKKKHGGARADLLQSLDTDKYMTDCGDEVATETFRKMKQLEHELLHLMEAADADQVFLQTLVRRTRAKQRGLVRKWSAARTDAFEDAMDELCDPPPNDMDYFELALTWKQQEQVLQSMRALRSHRAIKTPPRVALLEMDTMTPANKSMVFQKMDVLDQLRPGDNEYAKVKTWVDGFMRIPFDRYAALPVSLQHHGLAACEVFLEEARQTLDACVYGMQETKMQVMEIIGQWIVNPQSMGRAIAIHGPPGTGKTSIVKDGISKLLGRAFAFVALGGNSDAAFLEGHGYCYEGSRWGKIVQILMDSQCMNPVIFFDELDKVSNTASGQEIVGILTHLVDATQNDHFHDKYFEGVDLDLSKCLFIFSYNDASVLNPILKDRMYHIHTKGYDTKEKIAIARSHLLPLIQKQMQFAPEDIVLPDATLRHILTTTLRTQDAGVRQFKRALESIHAKLNLLRLTSTSGLFAKDLALGHNAFPFTVLPQHVDVLLKECAAPPLNPSVLAMFV